MPARAVLSGTISFGLVSIPVKFFTSASSEQVSFNMLHKKCGGRLKMQFHCPIDNEVVERSETVKGYEYAKGQYVQFTEEELKALETERGGSIEITEFVPVASVDFLQVEKSYYLGPDKGGDKAYRLLGEAMTAKGRVAVGRWSARGKEQVVLVRPYGKDGLVIHQLYYANEMRAFSEIDTGATFNFSDKERELAVFLAWLDAFQSTLTEHTTLVIPTMFAPFHLLQLATPLDGKGVPQPAAEITPDRTGKPARQELS